MTSRFKPDRLDARQFPAVQPTKAKPEAWWHKRGYEFFHCKCGHRYFEMGMVPKERSEIGPCEWCIEEKKQLEAGL
jgi:hypothetical protein